MTVITATDIAANGEARLLPEFSQSSKIKGLLKSLLGVVQTTEDTLFDIMNNTGIDTAEGAQLDNIGKLLRVSRDGHTDTQYRLNLYSKISINSSRANPESVLTLSRFVTGSNEVTLGETYPAEFHVNIVGGRAAPDGFLDIVSPIGVGSYLSTVPSNTEYWVVSEEGEEGTAGVLPEEGDESGHVLAEEVN
jgi:hypothetical protein